MRTKIGKNGLPHLLVICTICILALSLTVRGQVVVNLDLGNNALASNGAGFTKLGTASGDYAVNKGSYYLWTNIAGSGLNLAMTNIAEYGSAGTLDADGFYNISGNGPAYFTISNVPPGMPVTLYACWAWNGASHAPIIFFGGTEITVTNNGEMTDPSLATLQNVGTATAGAGGTVSGYWYGDEGGTPVGYQEGQIGALVINVGPCRPVVSLNGPNPLGVQVNTPFTDPGATAFETCGNPVTLTTNGTVNTSVAGAYTLTYTAVSAVDNATNTVTRTVNVWSSDLLNLDLAESGDGISTPANFNRLNYSGANMTFSAVSANGSTYTVGFTNVSGTYNFANYNTIDQDGFYVTAGVTAGFYVTGLNPGDLATLYACWAWNGSADPGVVTFGGSTETLNVGTDITAPSTNTFMPIGTATADGTGTVQGTWTTESGKQGQIGGMILTIGAPVPITNLVVTPASISPQCGSNVTFTAAASGSPPITWQWYDNQSRLISGATNAAYTVVDVTDASAGTYTVVAKNSYGSLTNTGVISAVLHTAPPIMTLNGGNPVTIALNSLYVDAGATAYDGCAQASLPVTSNNPVNTTVAGQYTVTYSATTDYGVPGTITRTVNVVTNTLPPNFGTNVVILDSTMTNIQAQLSSVFSVEDYNQFGPQRSAIFFKPGQYTNLDIPMGFYTQVLGLGQSPGDVSISGYLHSDGVLVNENATENFWRSVENLSMSSTNDNYMMWAVSQGTWLRRMHIEGDLDMANFTDGNYASGGFMADCEVDGTVSSISQQQWLSRNDTWGSWNGGVWNMVFVGVTDPPAGTWPASVYTTITNTPLIREKPYLYIDSSGNYDVMVPALETNSFGTTWANGPTPGTSIPISQFYIAQAGTDTAASINAALASGKNLILTPGVYQLAGSILVTNPDTIVMGLGYATLVPQAAIPSMIISDVNGVKVSGLIFDAGPAQSPVLLQVGTNQSPVNHSQDPIFIYDISMRVGGATPGTAATCLQINANDTVVDNLWAWRADHGNGVGWTQNACNNGVIVNGDRVTIYGLFVEHHQQYQTLWNGNWGRLYFYQSELPYDPPSQAAWSTNGEPGYPSYKVADSVTSHQAYGLGIYAVFIDSTNISCFDAIETPTNSEQVNIHDMINVYIAGDTTTNGVSALDHIINGTGATLYGPGFGGTATANTLWPNPTYNIAASVTAPTATITWPSESWHSYQVQYKSAVTSATWQNQGAPINGNDTLQSLTVPAPATNRFYQVVSY